MELDCWDKIEVHINGRKMEVISIEHKSTIFHQANRKTPPKGKSPLYIYGWRWSGSRLPRKLKKRIKNWLK